MYTLPALGGTDIADAAGDEEIPGGWDIQVAHGDFFTGEDGVPSRFLREALGLRAIS